MIISPRNMAEAIYKSVTGKPAEALPALVSRSARVIKNRRMLAKHRKILNALREISDRETKTVRLKVYTAKDKERDWKTKLETEVKKKYGAENVVSEFIIKRELLGGVRIEIGSEVLDATYKTRLKKLEKYLMA